MSDYATKADLDALEQRIGGKLDALDQRVEGKLDALEQRVEGKLDAMEARINDRIDSTVTTAVQESETRLLRAIYSLVESVNKRMNGFEQSQSNVISRLSTIETRLTEVEKRLNMPPAA